MNRDFPHRKYPCDECPVRRDNADNPRSKFLVERWAALRSTVDDGDGNEAPLGAPIFGCHKGAPGTDADMACAGWLASFGDRHLAVRLAVALGRVSAAVLHRPNHWPPLYDTWEEMAAAQTWRPGMPSAHLADGDIDVGTSATAKPETAEPETSAVNADAETKHATPTPVTGQRPRDTRPPNRRR